MKNNIPSEEAVLTGIYNYGIDGLVDVDSLITEETFTSDVNRVIYKCLKHSLKSAQKAQFSDFLSSSESLGLSEFVNKNIDNIKSILQSNTNLDNIRSHAQKIARLEFVRKLQSELPSINKNLNEVSGDESLSSILSLAESPIQKICLSYMKEDESNPKQIGENLRDYINHIMNGDTGPLGIPSGYHEYDKAIGGGFRRKCVDLISARPKALKYGSKVYTPTGYKLIEDVKIGDIIKHPFKGDTTVTEIWDHQDKEIYRIFFRDGDFVDCCEDHLWHVSNSYNGKEFLKTTSELINDVTYGKDRKYKWNIPLPNIIDFEESDVPIDPYALGILLGDGSVSNGTCVYHTADQEIHDYMLKYAQSIGCEVKVDSDSKTNKCISYRINSLQEKLRETGIFGHNCYSKFIPKEYIYNSKNVRLSILAGLLDTDGDCTVDKRSKQSRTRFCSVSKQLCLDVKEIVQSLGGLCSITNQKTTCDNKVFHSYRCEIRLPNGINPFKLKRKADKFTNRIIGKLKRTIIKIEKIGIDNARCLTLSENDGLFMTDNFVVTHNTGKSVLADNFALHVAGEQGIPVLMLDTEMSEEDHYNRIIANLTGIDINEIAKGSFKTNDESVNKVMRAVEYIESIPYSYISIAGKPFDEILSIARRWILKTVGYDSNGRLNDCLLVYDYLKLMNSGAINNNLAEFQVLGFQITALHNFCVEYDCPCVSFVQLNRDGITKESTDVVSGSDRLVWLCTSFSIFKDKTDEEIASDGIRNGNKKLIPIVARHGPGIDDEGYICLQMDGATAKIKELGTIRGIKRNANSNQEGFPDSEEYDEEDSTPF